jgi:hypothetical protein
MIETLETNIVRADPGGGLDTAPGVVVTPLQEESTIADLYARGQATSPYPAGQPLISIVSVGLLNSPDQVTASGGSSGLQRFEMNVEVRAFTGPLAANDPTIALISMKLGSLEPGSYELAVHCTRLRFREINHPERATSPMTSDRIMTFNCV